jgi:glutamyl-tRNA synthetase
MQTEKMKTRFAPSPTGYLHIGGARTALFNFLLARKVRGTFMLRIEDTDVDRHQEDAIAKIIDDLRWLGLEWDEGIDVDAAGKVVARGPNGPYRQSERLEIYRKYIQQLLDEGKAYYAFDTAEELDARRKQAEAAKTGFKYERPAKFPTAADAEAAKAGGRSVVVRFVCPAEGLTIHDEAFGDVTVPAAEMEDFVIRKSDGYPTFYLANVVDDAMMCTTLVCRGQEFLGQTWRQSALRRALGFTEPKFAHLPLIMDMQGRKLSKRDGDVEVHSFRVAGYLPEALVNFIALLGWSPPGDREKMTLAETIELFSIDRIGKANAKFDRDKLLAFNTDACAAATPERLLACFKDYLSLNETPFPKGDDKMLAHLLAICHGFRTFRDVVTKAGVLFVADDAYEFDPKAVEKVLKKGDGFAVLAEARAMLAGLEQIRVAPSSPLEGVCSGTERPLPSRHGESSTGRGSPFSREAIQKALDDFAAAKGAGMGKVAQPIRVAVAGTTISPGMAETLEILGREKTLARIDRCLAMRSV